MNIKPPQRGYQASPRVSPGDTVTTADPERLGSRSNPVMKPRGTEGSASSPRFVSREEQAARASGTKPESPKKSFPNKVGATGLSRAGAEVAGSLASGGAAEPDGLGMAIVSGFTSGFLSAAQQAVENGKTTEHQEAVDTVSAHSGRTIDPPPKEAAVAARHRAHPQLRDVVLDSKRPPAERFVPSTPEGTEALSLG